MGRAHAARLHVRRQGARADDRPADRDEAPARRTCARRSRPRTGREAAHLRQGPARRRCATTSGPGSPTASSRSRRPASSARSCSSTRAGSSPRRRTATPIEEAIGRLRDAGMTGAVEFRSASWFNEKNLERTLRFLGDRKIPLVIVDGPQGFKSSVPAVVAATSPDLAIVRFHGRRTATWEAKGIQTVERFRYLYDRDELADWAPRVRETAGAGEGHPRPVQQLLRELRRHQRARAGAAAARPRGRRRLVATTMSMRRGAPPRGAWRGTPRHPCSWAT